jgi:hypothetical protein
MRSKSSKGQLHLQFCHVYMITVPASHVLNKENVSTKYRLNKYCTKVSVLPIRYWQISDFHTAQPGVGSANNVQQVFRNCKTYIQ